MFHSFLSFFLSTLYYTTGPDVIEGHVLVSTFYNVYNQQLTCVAASLSAYTIRC